MIILTGSSWGWNFDSGVGEANRRMRLYFKTGFEKDEVTLYEIIIANGLRGPIIMRDEWKEGYFGLEAYCFVCKN